MRSMSWVSPCPLPFFCFEPASVSIASARCRSTPPLRVGLRLISRKTDELCRQIGILARTNAEHERAFAVPRYIGMPHGAVDVDALARGEPHRIVELQVHFDRAFDHEDELFTLVLQGFTKFCNVF